MTWPTNESVTFLAAVLGYYIIKGCATMSSPEQSPVDIEARPQSLDDNELQIDENQANMNRDNPNLDYDFEVKEQDRWLPIANGECNAPCMLCNSFTGSRNCALLATPNLCHPYSFDSRIR